MRLQLQICFINYAYDTIDWIEIINNQIRHYKGSFEIFRCTNKMILSSDFMLGPDILHLTDANFKDSLKKRKHVLVMFYASMVWALQEGQARVRTFC